MTKTFTIPSQNIHTIVRKEVIDVMREVLSDPDAGLNLTSNFTRRLKKSLKDKERGRITPLAKIFEQYGV
jgi:hypothetical protein